MSTQPNTLPHAKRSAPAPQCTHNAMRERKGDAVHAWECADCGHVYGMAAAAVAPLSSLTTDTGVAAKEGRTP